MILIALLAIFLSVPSLAWSAGDPPLDAEGLVAMVLAENPKLQAERFTLRSVRRSADAAGSFADPMVTYAVAPFALAGGEAVHVHSGEIAQTLPWFGKRGLEKETAAAEAGMQAAEVRALAQGLATQARKAYAEWLRLWIVQDGLREQLGRLDDLRKTTLAAIAAGRAQQADALMVESEFHMLHEEQLMNQSALTRVEASLAALAGRDVSARLSREVPEFPLDVTAVSPSPEVQAAAQARAGSEAAVRLQKKLNYPDVTLFAGVNTMWMNRDEWVMAGVRLDIPLQRTQRVAEVDAARAAAQAAEKRLAAAELARDEMRGKARAQLEEAENRRELYENTAIPLAARRLAAAKAAYANGQIAVEAVIAALRYEITARSTSELMRVQEYEAKAELAYANGNALFDGEDR